MFFSLGLFAMISSLTSSDCSSTVLTITGITCTDINKMSITNKILQPDLYFTQTWVNFLAIILIMLSLHKFRRVQKLTERECDRGLVSPSDYTIMISKLPAGQYTAHDIERLIIEKIPTGSNANEKIQIKKIVLAYNIADFVRDCRGLGAVEAQLRKAKEFEMKNKILPKNVNLEDLKGKSLEFKGKIEEFRKEIDKNEGINGKTCGDIFVTFSSQGNTQEILERYEFTSMQKYYNYMRKYFCCDKSVNRNKLHYRDTLLYVKRAPEPNDIIWENLGFSYAFRFKKRVLTNIATLVVLAACFCLICGISYYQVSSYFFIFLHISSYFRKKVLCC